jgi:formamidopyrimidine-DNA glycosylase
MPELPEVDTILQGIRPYVKDQPIQSIVIRQSHLRWEIPKAITQELPHHIIKDVKRRGKYLLFEADNGTAILHFGMSGSLMLLSKPVTPEKHDHFDLIFDHFYLRYTDPRRFGALLWTRGDPLQHPLLAHLGLEPFDNRFTGHYLHMHASRHKITIKQCIMNQKIVVGVGNIYATEALFLASIHPLTPANKISLNQYKLLAATIKNVLRAAIGQGGTTLKNFQNSEGKPGYFKQKLNVYSRTGLPCPRCHQPLKQIRIQNRATTFCADCQK